MTGTLLDIIIETLGTKIEVETEIGVQKKAGVETEVEIGTEVETRIEIMAVETEITDIAAISNVLFYF